MSSVYCAVRSGFLYNTEYDLFLNINQLDALNFIISLFQFIESGLLSQSVYGTATYRCDATRDCITQFLPS